VDAHLRIAAACVSVWALGRTPLSVGWFLVVFLVLCVADLSWELELLSGCVG
jgi:hypothetical protein